VRVRLVVFLGTFDDHADVSRAVERCLDILNVRDAGRELDFDGRRKKRDQDFQDAASVMASQRLC
jgi:hypothetical protein